MAPCRQAALRPLTLPGLAWPVELRPHPRARAMRLRLDEARERLLLTFPQRMSRRAALDWAGKQSEWVETQLARLEPAEPFAPGATIPVEGLGHRLVWETRRPHAAAGGRLAECGGPPEAFAGRIERFLRAMARDAAQRRNRRRRAARRSEVRSVSVGDAGSRWGSCSASGRSATIGGSFSRRPICCAGWSRTRSPIAAT